MFAEADCLIRTTHGVDLVGDIQGAETAGVDVALIHRSASPDAQSNKGKPGKRGIGNSRREVLICLFDLFCWTLDLFGLGSCGSEHTKNNKLIFKSRCSSRELAQAQDRKIYIIFRR